MHQLENIWIEVDKPYDHQNCCSYKHNTKDTANYDASYGTRRQSNWNLNNIKLSFQ